jgi:sugar phosphate isomerase/epimerase
MALRLGGPIFHRFDDPEDWARAHTALGYRAALCSLPLDAGDDAIAAYSAAAARHDLVISEVGAWSNPLSADPETARAAQQKCIDALALAERIGASCAVNIAGGCGEIWDGPHPENLSEETFARIVENTRAVIDAVRPTRTFFTLEAMPWIFPTGPAEYRRLIDAIDRPGFGVHLDPVNMVFSPERFFRSADLIRECFETLGPWIKNCHAKDIALRATLTVHLDEVRLGTGALDYGVFLRELARLGDDRVALVLEHLTTAEEYARAADYVRRVAAQEGIAL